MAQMPPTRGPVMRHGNWDDIMPTTAAQLPISKITPRTGNIDSQMQDMWEAPPRPTAPAYNPYESAFPPTSAEAQVMGPMQVSPVMSAPTDQLFVDPSLQPSEQMQQEPLTMGLATPLIDQPLQPEVSQSEPQQLIRQPVWTPPNKHNEDIHIEQPIELAPNDTNNVVGSDVQPSTIDTQPDPFDNEIAPHDDVGLEQPAYDEAADVSYPTDTVSAPLSELEFEESFAGRFARYGKTAVTTLALPFFKSSQITTDILKRGLGRRSPNNGAQMFYPSSPSAETSTATEPDHEPQADSSPTLEAPLPESLPPIEINTLADNKPDEAPHGESIFDPPAEPTAAEPSTPEPPQAPQEPQPTPGEPHDMFAFDTGPSSPPVNDADKWKALNPNEPLVQRVSRVLGISEHEAVVKLRGAVEEANKTASDQMHHDSSSTPGAVVAPNSVARVIEHDQNTDIDDEFGVYLDVQGGKILSMNPDDVLQVLGQYLTGE